MKTSNNLLVSSILKLLLLMGFSLSLQAADMDNQFSGIKKITIKTISGDLTLRPSTSGDVEVHVTSSYDESSMEMTMDQDGDELELEEDSIGYGSSSGNSHWTVGVPDGMEIDVRYSSASGGVVARDLSINLRANTASGDIELENFNGTVDGNTASGDIKLENVTGTTELNTARDRKSVV